MYIFDMELPLVLCDLGELLTDYAACLTSCDPADLLHCDVTGCLVSGPADQKWENCMTGEGVTTVHSSALATLHAMEMYDRKWWPILLRKLLVFGPTLYLNRDCKTAF